MPSFYSKATLLRVYANPAQQTTRLSLCTVNMVFWVGQHVHAMLLWSFSGTWWTKMTEQSFQDLFSCIAL